MQTQNLRFVSCLLQCKRPLGKEIHTHLIALIFVRAVEIAFRASAILLLSSFRFHCRLFVCSEFAGVSINLISLGVSIHGSVIAIPTAVIFIVDLTVISFLHSLLFIALSDFNFNFLTISQRCIFLIPLPMGPTPGSKETNCSSRMIFSNN